MTLRVELRRLRGGLHRDPYLHFHGLLHLSRHLRARFNDVATLTECCATSGIAAKFMWKRSDQRRTRLPISPVIQKR